MKSSGPIREVFARLAVCAAVLATSLFGRSLHELQHQVLDAVSESVVSDGHSSSKTTCHCAFHSHCHEPEQGSSERNDSKHSHDSDNCAVCYVIGLAATSPVAVSIHQTEESLVDRLVVRSESARSEFVSIGKARGPPAV